jgi:hypothetical protein
MPSVAGGVAAVVVALAIYAGSRGLRYFDAALVGYATATVFLAFGVTYRYAVWVSSPPARRYLRRGWQAFFSWRNFRRLPTAVPRSVLGYLGFQTFLRARGRGRWLAHQLLFWGVVLATLITFADLRLAGLLLRQAPSAPATPSRCSGSGRARTRPPAGAGGPARSAVRSSG